MDLQRKVLFSEFFLDSGEWGWSHKPDKLAVIVLELKEALEADQLEQRFIRSFYGKLEHIRELMPESKFHITVHRRK